MLIFHTVTVDQCDQPTDIINGTISYEDGDTNNIFVGNRIEYNCINGTELQGSKYRFCQRNGNWSGEEPECKGQILHVSFVTIFHCIHSNILVFYRHRNNNKHTTTTTDCESSRNT